VEGHQRKNVEKRAPASAKVREDCVGRGKRDTVDCAPGSKTVGGVRAADEGEGEALPKRGGKWKGAERKLEK